MIDVELVWKIECDECDAVEVKRYASDWFADFSDDALHFGEVAFDLELLGWAFVRETYEEMTPYCPKCTIQHSIERSPLVTQIINK